MGRTRARWGFGAAVLVALLGCAGLPDPTAPEPAPDAPAPPVPVTAPDPIATPAPDAPGSRLPPGPLDGAWIGLAARTGSEDGTVPKLDAALIVWDGIEAFRKLPPGTVAQAVGFDGPVPVRFRDVRKIPLGCDGLEQEVAVFDGPELPTGPVWLTADPGTARFEPAVETAKTDTRVAWEVGSLTVVTEAKGSGGRTTVRTKEGEERWSADWEGHPDAGPLDVGAWWLHGLLRSPDERILLFSASSLEGKHYTAVRAGPGKAGRLGEPVYLYWCAY